MSYPAVGCVCVPGIPAHFHRGRFAKANAYSGIGVGPSQQANITFDIAIISAKYRLRVLILIAKLID